MSAPSPIIIQKNGREEIRVTVDQFNGGPIASIRVWFRADDGTMRPGKSGIGFRLDLLPEVAAALREAEVGARRSGLLP